jgi:hypothetical protein
MIKSINKILYLLDFRFKKKLILFQLLIVTSSFFEVLGVLSIAPLIQVLTDFSILQDKTQLVTRFYIYSNASNFKEFIILVSIIILVIFFINFFFSIL